MRLVCRYRDKPAGGDWCRRHLVERLARTNVEGSLEHRDMLGLALPMGRHFRAVWDARTHDEKAVFGIAGKNGNLYPFRHEVRRGRPLDVFGSGQL